MAFYTALGWELSPASTASMSMFKTAGSLALVCIDDLLAELGGAEVAAAVPGEGYLHHAGVGTQGQLTGVAGALHRLEDHEGPTAVAGRKCPATTCVLLDGESGTSDRRRRQRHLAGAAVGDGDCLQVLAAQPHRAKVGTGWPNDQASWARGACTGMAGGRATLGGGRVAAAWLRPGSWS
jgi:hypothetical protein